MELRVYGPGCANCRRLEAHVREALGNMGRTTDVRKVSDITEITNAGVMRTPALGVDDKLVFQGRVPEVPELMDIITDAMQEASST